MIQQFKDNLIAGLQSSPILFIPHYHFSYIDEVIESILRPKTGERRYFSLDINSILEFDQGYGPVDFISKKGVSSSFSSGVSGFIKEVLSPLPPPKETERDNRIVLEQHQIFLLKNVHKEFYEPKFQSLLQTFVEKYERGKINPLRTIIFVSNCFISEVPKEVSRLFTVINIPTPDADDIEKELGLSDDIVSSRRKISETYSYNGYVFGISFMECFENNRKELVSALLGMQLYDIRKVLQTIIKIEDEINPRYERSHCSLAEHILREKRQLVNNSSLLEVIDLEPDQKDRIGNIGNLKKFIQKQSRVIDNISNYPNRLPKPKGVLLVGPPGCGKSETVKSIASIFDKTLLRLDLGKLMGKYVGESEHNLIEAIRIAEAAQPCVLWIDEIEKAFAGFGNNEEGNDITVTRMVGFFLTWMQERKSLVYLVATANDLSSLRPELLRKGRWDEIFYLSYPNKSGASEIFQKCLKKYGLYLAAGNDIVISINGQVNKPQLLDELGEQLSKSHFSGAEIDSLIVQAFNEDWDITEDRKVSYRTVLNIVQKISESKTHSSEDSRKDQIDKALLDYKLAIGQKNLPKEDEIKDLLSLKYKKSSPEEIVSEYKSKGYISASL